MAVQVRPAMRSSSTSQTSRAVSSGAIARTTRVLATVVMVSATMKQVNMTAHITPDTRPGQPAAEMTPSQREPLVTMR